MFHFRSFNIWEDEVQDELFLATNILGEYTVFYVLYMNEICFKNVLF